MKFNSYIIGRSIILAMTWYFLSTILIVVFNFFVLIMLLNAEIPKFFAEFGEYMIELFGKEYFFDSLMEIRADGYDMQEFFFVVTAALVGVVFLPLISCILTLGQMIIAIVLSAILLSFFYFVGYEKLLSVVILMSVQLITEDLIGSMMLVLFLIVFARSWRRMQATV